MLFCSLVGLRCSRLLIHVRYANWHGHPTYANAELESVLWNAWLSKDTWGLRTLFVISETYLSTSTIISADTVAASVALS